MCESKNKTQYDKWRNPVVLFSGEIAAIIKPNRGWFKFPKGEKEFNGDFY